MIFRRLLIAVVILASSGLVAAPAFADTAEVCGSTTDYASALATCGITFAGVTTLCQSQGDCTLTDIMQVFVNIGNFILTIVGTLIFVFFVYGGFRWLTSAGNPEMVQAGTNAMKNSVIGLIIVLVAFSAINFLTSALRGGGAGSTNLCELYNSKSSSGGEAGLGYACVNTSSMSSTDITAKCLTGLCPGDDTIKCCKQ